MKRNYELKMRKSSFMGRIPVTNNFREFEDEEVDEIIRRLEMMVKAWADKENLNVSGKKEKERHSLNVEFFEVKNSNIVIEFVHGYSWVVDIYLKYDSANEDLISELDYYLKNLENKIDGLDIDVDP